MRLLRLIPFVLALSVLLHSCCIGKKLSHNKNSFDSYLSSVLNDTVFYEIPEVTITDNKIYSILDSAIVGSEKCDYFDPRVKYLNAFRFAALPGNMGTQYSIEANISPYSAINLMPDEHEKNKEIGRRNAYFYYKHYLFVVPTAGYRGQKELEYFPFFKLSPLKSKVRAPKFQEEKNYYSFIRFKKVQDSLQITANELCGIEIMIR